MPNLESRESPKPALQNIALTIGLVVVSGWFISQGDSDPYGPFRYDGIANIDMVALDEHMTSPLFNTELKSSPTEVSVSLRQCSGNLVNNQTYDGGIEQLAIAALESRTLSQTDVTLFDPSDEARAVRCHAAKITLPDTITARLEMPVTYQIARLLDIDPVPRSEQNLIIDFHKAPDTFNEYVLVPGQNKTIWEQHQIAFVPSVKMKR